MWGKAPKLEVVVLVVFNVQAHKPNTFSELIKTMKGETMSVKKVKNGYENHCECCKNNWNSNLGDKVKSCPACKSYTWNKKK